MNSINPNFSFPPMQPNQYAPGMCDLSAGMSAPLSLLSANSSQSNLGIPQNPTQGLWDNGLMGIVSTLVQSLTQVVQTLASIVTSLFSGGVFPGGQAMPGTISGAGLPGLSGGTVASTGGTPGSGGSSTSLVDSLLSHAYDAIKGIFTKGDGQDGGFSLGGVIGSVLNGLGVGKLGGILGKVGSFVTGLFK